MRNLWNRFQNLTPPAKRLVGTCVDSAFGVSLIALPGGSVIQVRGTGTVGGRYFILDGRLDGEAPNLPTLEIDI
jgi:hypothetical protein